MINSQQAIVTSDQFVAGIIATLALDHRKKFTLTETELDQRFAQAYNELAGAQSALGLTANFTFLVDPMHGDSVTLRDTLLTARDRELIAFNNPTFRTFTIQLNQSRAERYLERNPIPTSFYKDIVSKYFSDMHSQISE